MTLAAYRSTMVRRWHTNPHLSHTVDPVGYHGARMAVLAILLFPKDTELVESCITHDLGEYASGDVPWLAKYYSPMKAAANKLADEWSFVNGLAMHLDTGDETIRRLKFLDRADAYLWMLHHARRLRKTPDWKGQRTWLADEAISLDVADKWVQIAVDAARG